MRQRRTLKQGWQGQKCDKKTTQRGCQSERGDMAREMRRNGTESVSENISLHLSRSGRIRNWFRAHSHTGHPAIQKSFLRETHQRAAVVTKLQFFSPSRSGVPQD